MEIKTIECQSCGASIEIDNSDNKTWYCQYCGTKNYIDDGTRIIVIHNEAEEEKYRLKQERFHQQKLEDDAFYAYQADQKKRRNIWRVFALLGHSLFGAGVMCMYLFEEWQHTNSDAYEKLVLSTLLIYIICPIIISCTRPFIPIDKNDINSTSKMKMSFLYYGTFFLFSVVAMVACTLLK